MMKEKIRNGETFLGIELGSTRIKACLITENSDIVASGSYEWENKFENGYWTYSLEEIHKGVQGCFSALSAEVEEKYGIILTKTGALGISGMMHGYLAFDDEGKLLVPFRTWRNSTTKKAADELTELFEFNIPQRWSIAHLYQAILDREEHVKNIAHIATLAGYIHYLLTGRYEVGIGEASGIFPIKDGSYDSDMIEKFRGIAKKKGCDADIEKILPSVKRAGEKGAFLTAKGAKFLDVKGNFEAGIPVCPPEGDAGTGMVATNAVLPKTANVSAGTSVFSMLVLEENLKGFYPEVDVVTTPDGCPVAMVHCNNCCSELDVWVNIFGEFAELFGADADKSQIYEILYKNAMEADASCGGIVAYNYISGENITGAKTGVPMYFRKPGSSMTLGTFMRSQLYSAFATLKIGMDILAEKENVIPEIVRAHGGIFKVTGVAQQILADALKTCVSVTKTSGEGGAWGMALLALYMMKSDGKPLGEWLADKVFDKTEVMTKSPDAEGAEGFSEYINLYKKGLDAEIRLGEKIC